MTVVAQTPGSMAGSSLRELTERMTALLGEHRTAAQWWVELTSTLDQLSSRLLARASEHGSRGSMGDQIRQDAPHLFSRVRRLDSERDDLADDVFRVRVMTGQAAGDPSQLSEITTTLRDLTRRVRRYDQHTADVLYEAYALDIGGE